MNITSTKWPLTVSFLIKGDGFVREGNFAPTGERGHAGTHITQHPTAKRSNKNCNKLLCQYCVVAERKLVK